MLKILKNEIMKMISGKKFYILLITLIASIVIGAIEGKVDQEAAINANNFGANVLFGMLMRPMVPMFMVIVVAETLTEDYSKGTMKFSLMATIKKSELIVGKLLFIALYALIFLVVGFIGNYIVGSICFGLGTKGEFLNTFIKNVKIYSSVLLPLISFSTVISFIALIVNSSGAFIGLGIGLDIIMLVLDQMKNMVYYTFTGGMYATDIVNNLRPNSTLIFSFTALIYIVIFTVLSIIIIKKKDIVL